MSASKIAMLVTCSSIGEAAERARPLVELPILRISSPRSGIARLAGDTE
ncbi:hypothetical protein [Nonomuraea turkmeniaca]|nr:hypothetical protein [Nonomuraea turkmeniaca]